MCLASLLFSHLLFYKHIAQYLLIKTKDIAYNNKKNCQEGYLLIVLLVFAYIKSVGTHPGVDG